LIASNNLYITGVNQIAIASLVSFIFASNSACCLAKLPHHFLNASCASVDFSNINFCIAKALLCESVLHLIPFCAFSKTLAEISAALIEIPIDFNCSVSQRYALANISAACVAVYCQALHSLNAHDNAIVSVVNFVASSLANHIGINKSCNPAAAFKYSFCDNHMLEAVSFAISFTQSI